MEVDRQGHPLCATRQPTGKDHGAQRCHKEKSISTEITEAVRWGSSSQGVFQRNQLLGPTLTYWASALRGVSLGVTVLWAHRTATKWAPACRHYRNIFFQAPLQTNQDWPEIPGGDYRNSPVHTALYPEIHLKIHARIQDHVLRH